MINKAIFNSFVSIRSRDTTYLGGKLTRGLCLLIDINLLATILMNNARREQKLLL